mgnify:CR=1 FL=1
MNIVHLTAGAGGMYCGTCLQSNTLAAALRATGHSVLLVPLYTPLRIDEATEALPEVAFGGIRAYLQQQWPFFRHLPRRIQRLLDSPALLHLASRFGQNVRPERLGALTVSVLRGEQGRLDNQLDELVQWLARDIQPQVVHFSTGLLAGMARRIRQGTDARMVANLSSEDAFLDRLPDAYRHEAVGLMAQACSDLDGLVAPSQFARQRMAKYLHIDPSRIDVIRPGLASHGHAHEPRGTTQTSCEQEGVSNPGPVLGFLARICPEKGLHLLVQAFQRLSRLPAMARLRLRVAGHVGPQDRAYLAKIRQDLSQAGLAHRFEVFPDPDRTAKLQFLQSLDILCVPAIVPQSKALYVIEAFMNGVPVVLPDHGAFHELVHESEGGLLYRPDDADDLVAKLGELLLDRSKAKRCAQRCLSCAQRQFTAARMADEILALYVRLRNG